MFGKGKLLRDGPEAQGIVIKSSVASVSSNASAGSRYHVTVKVTFDDDSTAEISHWLSVATGFHDIGAVVPVRYDPADRSKVEIDVPAMEASHKAAIAAIDERALARGERQIAWGEDLLAKGVSPSQVAGGYDDEMALLAQFQAEEDAEGGGGASAPSSSPSRLDKLQQLADLHRQGVLTDDELAAEKAKILSES